MASFRSSHTSKIHGRIPTLQFLPPFATLVLYLASQKQEMWRLPPLAESMESMKRTKPHAVAAPASMGKKFSEEEVAKHNTAESCWIIINGKVLDVTKWLANHPGGKSVLLSVGGKDATFDFSTIGHSAGAWTASEKYVIGEIGQPGVSQTE